MTMTPSADCLGTPSARPWTRISVGLTLVVEGRVCRVSFVDFFFFFNLDERKLEIG